MPLEIERKIREPEVGMNIVIKKVNCNNCGGSFLAKGDGGKITSIDKEGVYFEYRDWASRYQRACIMCCNELKEITKAEWNEICDKEEKRMNRRRV